MTEGPIAEYRTYLAEGVIERDADQEYAVARLQSLYTSLREHARFFEAKGWRQRLGISSKRRPLLQWVPESSTEPRQGLYIFGEVGTGKSMLMDMFFSTAPVTTRKRVHFHAFMRDVHQLIHEWRQGKTKDDANPLLPLAKKIAAEAWLLCFDELQVTDIGDAMILGRLFTALFNEGVVCVITSNRPPEDLYKDGLQRERFIPFIKLIRKHLDVIEVSGGRDYRLGRSQGVRVYHSPADEKSEEALAEAFLSLTHGVAAEEEVIETPGRRWIVPRAARGVAWFDFPQLCQTTLGPSDYLALANRYHTIIVSRIPELSSENRDAAKRFVTFIDAVYENKGKFLCSAAAAPELLYPRGDGAFEFQRTVSRLMEMQSEIYLAQGVHSA